MGKSYCNCCDDYACIRINNIKIKPLFGRIELDMDGEVYMCQKCWDANSIYEVIESIFNMNTRDRNGFCVQNIHGKRRASFICVGFTANDSGISWSNRVIDEDNSFG